MEDHDVVCTMSSRREVVCNHYKSVHCLKRPKQVPELLLEGQISPGHRLIQQKQGWPLNQRKQQTYFALGPY